METQNAMEIQLQLHYAYKSLYRFCAIFLYVCVCIKEKNKFGKRSATFFRFYFPDYGFWRRRWWRQ